MSAGVELRAGELRLALRPDLGGCIAGLWLGEHAVLWSHEAASLSVARPSGCFPLVPYSNRLAFRRFQWQGQDHSTEANSGASPHSMHGVAWQRPWDVRAASADGVALAYRHLADAGWPFDFEVVQHLALTAHGLALRLQFTNTARQAQPVGLGWHPYFAKRPGSRLRVALGGRWESDAQGLPTMLSAVAGIDADVADLALDHCFEGWPGVAELQDEVLRITLSSSLRYLVVYTPGDKDFYCVEPVSHANDAIHSADPLARGLRSLAPGERFEAQMKLLVARA